MKNVVVTSFTIIFVILFSACLNQMQAKGKIEKILAEKKFEISKDARLIIDHKYGKVQCNNWNENAISIKVTVSVETDDEKKAEKIFNEIQLNIHGNRHEVVAECDLNQKFFKNDKYNVSINFEIYMPKSINLELKHKFGTAFIDEVDGTAEITSEYGSIKINSLNNPENDIEVNFGKGELRHIESGDIEIDYSKFDLGTAGILSVESKYSDFIAEEIEEISIEQEGGKVEIGKTKHIDGSSKFSDFEIGELSHSLFIETEYGNLIVKNVSADFSEISVENSFGSVKIFIDENATYSLAAETEFCTLKYPEELADFSYKNISFNKASFKGVIGKGKNSKSKVTIDSEYGGVSLIVK